MFLKRMKAGLLLAVSLALAPAVVAAKDAKAEPRPDDVICTVERTTGSHLPQRTCSTRAKREQQARRAQEDAQRVRTSPTPRAGGN